MNADQRKWRQILPVDQRKWGQYVFPRCPLNPAPVHPTRCSSKTLHAVVTSRCSVRREAGKTTRISMRSQMRGDIEEDFSESSSESEEEEESQDRRQVRVPSRPRPSDSGLG